MTRTASRAEDIRKNFEESNQANGMVPQIATTSSYRDKDNNLDYFTALSQFLLQSWHELPDTSSKDIHANLDSSGKDKHTNQEHSHYDKYMNPTCLV
jgi:hypothetical protein